MLPMMRRREGQASYKPLAAGRKRMKAGEKDADCEGDRHGSCNEKR